MDDLKLPTGVSLEADERRNHSYFILFEGRRVGRIAEWPKRTGGTEWESRGVGQILVGDYDTAQQALDESLKDSGILIEE